MRIRMDYYPEWDADEMWEADAGRMKEAGVFMVRIGEFGSQIQPHIEDGFQYESILKSYHGALVLLGAGTDVLHWTEPLDGYKLEVAPYLYLMDEEITAKLKAFAESGSTLILTCRSGIKNLNNTVWPMEVPGPLAECAGLIVKDWDALFSDTVPVQMNNGKTYLCSQWADIIEPAGAEPIGWYCSEYYAGRTAVTVNRAGSGSIYYTARISGRTSWPTCSPAS
ncbi:beta-galactosidase [Paenibacillus glycanilyticus]|uniref:beta-galactosidase trimerization domain-containing protein n=1 Tax=Paenibacillus glycanilyticus TaxID=126569 RepID=UPI00203D9297|nr:beta-galactosidase trimerization domain-containing protein [Paenibacillus glycanilyticus]MCM3631606.1 beta-galactosidase [Paenibacillus glycanilyticus]